MPTDQDGHVAAAYGPVLNVRALRGREVTAITIEIPCEYHVQATGLLYEKTAIVTPARLPTSVGYGIVHSDMVDEASDDELRSADGAAPADLPSGALLAHVAIVRPAPSRGVTILTLELPLDFHVDATTLLFGRDVLIAPSSLPPSVPLGPLAPNDDSVERREPAARGAGDDSQPRAQRAPGSGLVPKGDDVQPARWLGIHCAEADFQGWLEVHNEGQAVARVRELCEVESRREIATNPRAKQLFLAQIYRPYREHLRKKHLARHGQAHQAPASAFARFRA